MNSRPRQRQAGMVAAGASVTVRMEADTVAKVLASASGPKRRPSWAYRARIGRKETAAIISELTSGAPNSSSMVVVRATPLPWTVGATRASCPWAASRRGSGSSLSDLSRPRPEGLRLLFRPKGNSLQGWRILPSIVDVSWGGGTPRWGPPSRTLVLRHPTGTVEPTDPGRPAALGGEDGRPSPTRHTPCKG